MAEKRPSIGIVTTRLPTVQTIGGQKKLRPAVHFCRIAAAADKLGGTVLLFVPDDVQWNAGKVMAWTPVDATRPFEGWMRTSFPIPSVIYENVYVHLAVNGYSNRLRQEAAKRKIPLFNPVMPGKWQMTKLLQSSDCKLYMPPTDRLDDIGAAVAKVREWGTAYVKPCGGYGGNGVTRIEFVGQGRYRVSVDRLNGERKDIRTVVSEPDLATRLRRLRTQQPHLVQRGLALMTVGGRKLDFRVVVHRDGKGEWQLVGIVPKQAARDGVVTNLIAGGERLSLQRCVQLARAEGKTIPVGGLRDCALRIASLLSQRNRHAALAGFDLGVDEHGHVWMIEMNPKPARSLMTDDMRAQLAIYQAGFAMYLANGRQGGGR